MVSDPWSVIRGRLPAKTTNHEPRRTTRTWYDLPMSALTIGDVERIAALAHLELTEDEKHLFVRQLGDILTYAEQIQRLDTSGVAATAHVHPGARVERAD